MGILYRINYKFTVKQQAVNVIVQKIKGELASKPNIAREIEDITTGEKDCCVTFKNKSTIRAITLAQDRGGDSARSWRFQILLVDEARLVKDDIIEEVLIPMTKTPRQEAIRISNEYKEEDYREEARIIFISSAHLKISPLYSRFKYHYSQMKAGNNKYFVTSLDYHVGVYYRLFSEEDILQEKEKPTMTAEKFSYEYEAIFSGSSGESYYPYDLTSKSRVLTTGELRQPKDSKSRYILVHDVAVSDEKKSDNACTHIIKIQEKPNGGFIKDVVFTKTVNGRSLKDQRDDLRKLIHIDFPNIEKVIIDTQSAGEGLAGYFDETWKYTDEKGDEYEFPPLIQVGDEARLQIENAEEMIIGIKATKEFNQDFYPYMKSCFEDGSLRITIPADEINDSYIYGEQDPKLTVINAEHDILVSELSNIKQEYTSSNNMVYKRIVESKKRDRATSLMYGLSYIMELEKESKIKHSQRNDNALSILASYVFYN